MGSTFPIQWPELFTSIFQIGGAITAMGQHLVNIKCLVPEFSDADVFYMTRVLWALLPVVVVGSMGLMLLLMGTILKWSKDVVNGYFRISIVALLYLMWPSLCTET